MVITTNKRAYFDHEILETYEAGVELKGFEVKSIKNGRINLAGSYVVFRKNQFWLLNADIPAYQPKNAPENYESKQTRRLLLKRSEIDGIIGHTSKKAMPCSDAGRLLSGLTLLPLKVYTKGKSNLIKIEIGLAKSRKKADKRELLKKREAMREIRNESF
ncbi:MAG: SsrA-binding protein SmpB [Spirochaetota bacterium]